MNEIRLFGVGHSHVSAIIHGAACLSPSEGIIVDGINLRNDAFRNLSTLPLDSPQVQEIRQRAARAHLIFLSIQGNQYSIFGLVESPTPVDFYHARLPDLAIQDGAVVVPYRTMRQVLEAALERVPRFFALAKKLFDQPLVQCQPPPPKPSESYIRAHPGAFREELSRSRVTPPSVRLKMWTLQCEIMREMCEQAGIPFLPCPAAALDDSGYLVESAWAEDPTHGNSSYGALVLRQLAEVARSRQAAVRPPVPAGERS